MSEKIDNGKDADRSNNEENENNAKEAALGALLCVLVILPVIALLQKLGIKKWRIYDVPLSWGEFFSQMPLLLVLGFFIFFIIFIFLMAIEGKSGYPTVTCIKCLNSFPGNDYEDNNCEKCGGKLEPTVGFFDRHPEMINSKRGK